MFVLTTLAGLAVLYLLTHLIIGRPWIDTRADRATLDRFSRKDHS